MVLLKTILIVLLVYFGLRLFIRLATPYLMKYIAKKAGERFKDVFGSFPENGPPKKEGSITIDKPKKHAPRSKETVGEYVDFEEVEQPQ